MSAEHPRPPRISVVTIGLNAARDLPLTLESIIAQDYPSLELVVIDGMSWDGSAAILARYRKWIDRLAVMEDNGIYFAMNEAADLASGEYVLFLNAGDTFYDAGAVGRIMAALRDDPDVFYGNHIFLDGRIELFRRSASFEELSFRLRTATMGQRWHDQIPCHQATFTRTSLLRALRYDTQLLVGADHEFLFRAHAAGARFQYVDELVAHYRGGGFSHAMGRRTMLENVSTYRGFSERPARIDERFLPGGSPFPPLTARTGLVLGGVASTAGGTQGGMEICPDGARLLSGQSDSWGIEISGTSAHAGKSVTLLAGTVALARADLPMGSFRLDVRFDRIVPPSTILTIRPDRASDANAEPDRAAPLVLRSFRFLTPDTLDHAAAAPGDVILLTAGAQAALSDVLGSGWAAPEPTHLWSVGSLSDLWFRAAPEVRGLQIELSGNPHVEHGRQPVRIILNGRAVAETVLMHGERQTLDIPAHDVGWLVGQRNHLAFAPERVATPPPGSGDTRVLGVCLWRLTFT